MILMLVYFTSIIEKLENISFSMYAGYNWSVAETKHLIMYRGGGKQTDLSPFFTFSGERKKPQFSIGCTKFFHIGFIWKGGHHSIS